MAVLSRYVDQDNGTDSTGGGQGESSGSGAWATLVYAVTQISGYSSGDSVILYVVGSGPEYNTNSWVFPTMAIDDLQIIGDIPQDGTYTGYDSTIYELDRLLYASQTTTTCPVHFSRMQFIVTGTKEWNYQVYIDDWGTDDFDFDQCYFERSSGSSSAGQGYSCRVDDDNQPNKWWRCAFVNRSGQTIDALYLQSDAADVRNCLMYGWDSAALASLSNSAGVPLHNCVAHTNTSDFADLATGDYDYQYNCTEDDITNDVNHIQTTQTAAQLWTDSANDNWTIVNTSADTYASGYDESVSFTTDITGNTYSTNDIGPWAYVSAGGGGGNPWYYYAQMS